MEYMDLEQFDKWCGEFRTVLTQFKQQEESLSCVPTTSNVADQEFFNECHTQLCATKALIKLADDLDCSGCSNDCELVEIDNSNS